MRNDTRRIAWGRKSRRAIEQTKLLLSILGCSSGMGLEMRLIEAQVRARCAWGRGAGWLGASSGTGVTDVSTGSWRVGADRGLVLLPPTRPPTQAARAAPAPDARRQAWSCQPPTHPPVHPSRLPTRRPRLCGNCAPCLASATTACLRIRETPALNECVRRPGEGARAETGLHTWQAGKEAKRRGCAESTAVFHHLAWVRWVPTLARTRRNDTWRIAWGRRSRRAIEQTKLLLRAGNEID
jgi:hypothetical protein